MTSAVIVIVERGQQRVFSSPLLCHLLPNTLFWGPDDSVKFAESCQRTDQWIHPQLAFGGALIDLDNKRLSWFMNWFGLTQADGGARPHARVLYQRLLETRWPGYSIEYAHNGLRELATIAEKDPTTLPAIPAEYQADMTSPGEDDELFHLDHPSNMEEAYENMDGVVGFGQVAWVCVTDANGGHRNFQLSAYPWDRLEKGPTILDRLLSSTGSTVPSEKKASLGLWIDLKSPSIHLWGTRVSDARFRRIEEAWPGYSITVQDDGYRWQSEATNQTGSAILMTDDELLCGFIVSLESRALEDVMKLQTGCATTMRGFVLKGAGCLISLISLPVVVMGLLTGDWTTTLSVGGVILGFVILLAGWILWKMRKSFREAQEDMEEHQPSFVAGPENKSERRTAIDEALSAADLPSLAKMERTHKRMEKELIEQVE